MPLSLLDLPDVRAAVSDLYRILEHPAPTNEVARRALQWDTARSRHGEQNPDSVLPAALIRAGVERVLCYFGGHYKTDCPEITDSHLDFTVPFKTWLPGTEVWSGLPAKFKFGPAYSYRKRDSSLRIFNFSFQPSFIDLDPTLPFDEFYGRDNITFSFVSDEFNGKTKDASGHVRPVVRRTFHSFTEAKLENAQSRIYLGIHWAFDRDEGVKQGDAIADHIFAHALQPIKPPIHR